MINARTNKVTFCEIKQRWIIFARACAFLTMCFMYNEGVRSELSSLQCMYVLTLSYNNPKLNLIVR